MRWSNYEDKENFGTCNSSDAGHDNVRTGGLCGNGRADAGTDRDHATDAGADTGTDAGANTGANAKADGNTNADAKTNADAYAGTDAGANAGADANAI